MKNLPGIVCVRNSTSLFRLPNNAVNVKSANSDLSTCTLNYKPPAIIISVYSFIVVKCRILTRMPQFAPSFTVNNWPFYTITYCMMGRRLWRNIWLKETAQSSRYSAIASFFDILRIICYHQFQVVASVLDIFLGLTRRKLDIFTWKIPFINLISRRNG